jgi:Leucine-rich repeat (LRR) protein
MRVIRKSLCSFNGNKLRTDLIRDQIKALDESFKQLRESDSNDLTALPVLDLISNNGDETTTPADHVMER